MHNCYYHVKWCILPVIATTNWSSSMLSRLQSHQTTDCGNSPRVPTTLERYIAMENYIMLTLHSAFEDRDICHADCAQIPYMNLQEILRGSLGAFHVSVPGREVCLLSSILFSSIISNNAKQNKNNNKTISGLNNVRNNMSNYVPKSILTKLKD